MSQIFSPRFGFLFRLGLIVALIVLLIVIFLWRAVTAEPVGLNDPVRQPVPFSHKHHVGDDGIDCRYCHAAVEKSSFAGIPPLSTCMTCHSQLFSDQPVLAPLLKAYRGDTPLRWQRVHKLPDFVYFNHSIHIAKGVGCASCHGPVDTMPLTRRVAPLTMQWCLDCHREPEKALRPRAEIFNLHWQAADQEALGAQLLRDYHIDKRRMTDCTLCHR